MREMKEKKIEITINEKDITINPNEADGKDFLNATCAMCKALASFADDTLENTMLNLYNFVLNEKFNETVIEGMQQ